MANGMLIAPQDMMKLMGQQMMSPAQAPSGMNQWEQMAFNVGSGLGNLAGGGMIMPQIAKGLQAEQAKQAAKQAAIGEALKIPDLAARYTKAAEVFTEMGDFDMAQKYSSLAQRESGQARTEAGKQQDRETRAGQWAADYALKVQALPLNEQYKKAMIKTMNKDSKDSITKKIDQLEELHKVSQDASNPIRQQAAAMLLNKEMGIKPSTGVKPSLVDQTKVGLTGTTIGGKSFDSLDPKVQDYVALRATEIAEGLKGQPNAPKDPDKLRQLAIQQITVPDNTGSSWWDAITGFFGFGGEGEAAPTTFKLPDGTDVTMEDLEFTAQQNNMTVEQVKKQLEIR